MPKPKYGFWIKTYKTFYQTQDAPVDDSLEGFVLVDPADAALPLAKKISVTVHQLKGESVGPIELDENKCRVSVFS